MDRRLTPSPACDRMMEATTMSKPSQSNDDQHPHRPQSSFRREGPSQGPRGSLGPRKPDVVRTAWHRPRKPQTVAAQGVLTESTEPDPPPAKAAEKGIALTELLDRVKGVINEGFPRAEWVRAEISELRGKNGHLYLTLCERNDQGDILAQAKGIIWRNRARGHHRQVRGSHRRGAQDRHQDPLPGESPV